MIEHADLDTALRVARAVTSASGAHGIVAGSLCVAGDRQRFDWLALILGHARDDTADGERLAQGLRALHDETRRQLAQQDFGFELLLADDTRSARERADALADWCRGYIIGLMRAGVRDWSALSAEAREIAGDLLVISGAESDPCESAEEESRALTELEEYVRMGVQLIYLELRRRSAET